MDLFDLDVPFAWVGVSLLLAAIGRCLIFSSLLEGVITCSAPPDAILSVPCNPGSTIFNTYLLIKIEPPIKL